MSTTSTPGVPLPQRSAREMGRWPLRRTERRRVEVPSGDLLPWFLDRSPVGLFRTWGPVPGIAAVVDRDRDWAAAGARRTVVLADGGRVVEQVLAHRPPDLYRYRMTGFAGLMAHLVTSIDGQWTVAPAGDGASVVEWSYTFRDRGGAARLVLAPMVPTVWRGYMGTALAAVAAAALRELS